MKFARLFLITLVLAWILGAAASCVVAATLVVDTLKQTVTCDDSSLEPRFLKPVDSQLGTFVQNTLFDSRQATIKFTGLENNARYDVYVNGKYIGVRNSEELANGLAVEVPGRVVDSRLMTCLEKVKPLLDAEYARLKDIRSSEPMRICATLQQAIGWVRSAMQIEKNYRSVTVVLVPEGRVLVRPPVPTRLDYEDTRAGIARSCRLLHEARARMSSVIKDLDLRNSAVISLTPVDLATRLVKGNGKPVVEAVVTNYCDIPISGSVTVDVPKGWQSNKKSLTFSNLQSGKSFRASFNLNPGKTSSTLPEGIKVSANIKVVHDGLSADYTIKAAARTPSFESAVMSEPELQTQTTATPVYTQSKPQDFVGK